MVSYSEINDAKSVCDKMIQPYLFELYAITKWTIKKQLTQFIIQT